LVDVAVVLPVAGAVITTAGIAPRLTVMADGALAPNALVQTSVIVLAPVARATELVETLVVAVPLIVQVVPAGMLDAPLTV
jgi:hypothetical protein